LIPEKIIRYQKMLENERSFDELFSEAYKDRDFFLYYNVSFSDDPIFNHAILSDVVLDSEESSEEKISEILEKIIEQAKTFGVPASLFVDEFRKNAPRLEKVGIELGYRIFEKMEILSKDLERLNDLPRSLEIVVSETIDIETWNDVFVRSFGIGESWLDELEKRTKKLTGDPKTILLLARERDCSLKASGCLLLHIHPPECAGIYSVGTLPERRGHGVAKALMYKAESLAKEKSSLFATLQTVTSDSVTPMYLKLGYNLDFERVILQAS
jgi:GNAT superfamily N-acetyltransferase